MGWVRIPNEENLKKNPHLKDFLSFLDVHNEECSCAAVLVACSFLEEQLRRIIDSFLLKDSDRAILLEGFNAPLGTFSARIKGAHCLGLISDTERDDCDTLRKIRNEFAHSHLASFSDVKVVDLCKKLYHSAKSYGDVTVSALSSGAVGLALNLVNRARYVGEERLHKREWKR